MIGKVVVAVFLWHVAASEMSSYVFVQPDMTNCSKSCGKEFPRVDEKESKECQACCRGCRILQIIGVTEENGVVSESGVNKCHEDCKSYSVESEKMACVKGCDRAQQVGVNEIAKMKGGMDMFSVSSLFENLGMGQGFSPMLKSLFGGEESKNVEKIVSKDSTDDIMKQFTDSFNQMLGGFLGGLPNAPATKPKKEVTDEKTSIFFPLGVLPVKLDDSMALQNEPLYREKSHHAGYVNNIERDLKTEPKTETSGTFGLPSNGLNMAYLKSLCRDQRTVEILLITSVTACLFAIVWILCGSSNPIRRRNLPPPYETLIEEGDMKKQPVLFVGGLDEKALPAKCLEDIMKSKSQI